MFQMIGWNGIFSSKGKAEFLYCEGSGLFKELITRGLLLEYVKKIKNQSEELIIRAPLIPFISYSTEWCLSNARASAMTLEIELTALRYGCSLKDASTYNVQFQGVYPCFIDHGSFEPYEDGRPWVAYNQFCEHFLSPLLILSRRSLAPNEISGTKVSGIKIDLASNLLPRLSFNAFAHIHLQNYFLKKYSKSASQASFAKSTVISLKEENPYFNHSTIASKTWMQNLARLVQNYYDFGSNNYP